MTLSDQAIATLTTHRNRLRLRFGEFVPDERGERLLAETEAVIGSILFLGSLQLAGPVIERVEAFRADDKHGLGDAAAVLYAAADALKAVLAGAEPHMPHRAVPGDAEWLNAALTDDVARCREAAKPATSRAARGEFHSFGTVLRAERDEQSPTCDLLHVWPEGTDSSSLTEYWDDTEVPFHHLDDLLQDRPPRQIRCRQCGGVHFHVGLGDMFTAIRCSTCMWECGWPEG